MEVVAKDVEASRLVMVVEMEMGVVVCRARLAVDLEVVVVARRVSSIWTTSPPKASQWE